MSKRILLCLLISALLCSTGAQPPTFIINQTLSDSTWHFFRNRNRLISFPSQSHRLLLDMPHPVPSHALLSPRKMLFLLGPRFFNPKFLAISQPQESRLYPEGQLVLPKSQDDAYKGFRRRLESLRLNIKGISERRVERMATAFGVCPILYKWCDYGDQYWPRWVREGRCVNLGGTSCSLPPGMFCLGHEETTVVLLRYVCPQHGNEDKCNWYRMQKPVLISCKCACR